MARVQKMDNQEIAAQVADVARSLRQIEQTLGERKGGAQTNGQAVALQVSAQLLRAAAGLVDSAGKSLASAEWEAS